MKGLIRGFYPNGGTHLYDAVLAATDRLAATATPEQISAIVVLSDGADEGSAHSLEELLRRIKPTEQSAGIRVFTIAYGAGAKFDVLEKISATTSAKAYRSDTTNISRVFREISTFF